MEIIEWISLLEIDDKCGNLGYKFLCARSIINQLFLIGLKKCSSLKTHVCYSHTICIKNIAASKL